MWLKLRVSRLQNFLQDPSAASGTRLAQVLAATPHPKVRTLPRSSPGDRPLAVATQPPNCMAGADGDYAVRIVGALSGESVSSARLPGQSQVLRVKQKHIKI